MSLQLTLETTSIVEKHKSEVRASDLLDGPGKTEVFEDISIIPRPSNLDNRGFVMSTHSAGFVKLQRSEETEELMFNDPHAFMIITAVAYRAKRTDSFSSLGLKKGEALIGHTDFPGMSRQQYRSTLAKILTCHFLTIKTTNKGTIAKLSDSRVYDINIEQDNHQNNHPVTINQPSDNHRITTNKEVKKERRKEKITPKPPSEVACELLKFFIESLRKHLPSYTHTPDQTHAIYFDLIMENYSLEEIKEVIHFCHTDDFWNDKVFFPENLYQGKNEKKEKEKTRFGQLQMAMKRNKPNVSKNTANAPRSEDNKPRNPNVLRFGNGSS